MNSVSNGNHVDDDCNINHEMMTNGIEQSIEKKSSVLSINHNDDVDDVDANHYVKNNGNNMTTNTTDQKDDNNNNNSGYYIRWSRVEKSVQVAGTKRNSIAMQSHRRSTHITQPPPSSSQQFANNNKSNTIDAVNLQQGQQNIDATTVTTTKQILKSISGFANPGEVMALMGPSGKPFSSFMSTYMCVLSYVDFCFVLL